MDTLLDRNTQVDQARELHNSMINERYREILGVVEGQFAEEASITNTTSAYAPVIDAPSVETHNAPVVEQTPRVTQYTPNGVAATLFTTETLDRVAARPVVEDSFAPTVVMPQPVVKPASVVEREATYSLTPMAKILMAAFTAVVIIMLALIGANAQTIQRKSLRLKNLEETKQELVQLNENIQREIEELQKEENIIKRATEAGLLN